MLSSSHQCSPKPPDSALISGTGTQFTSHNTVTGASSGSSTALSGVTGAEDGTRNGGTNNYGKGLANSKELVSPCLVSADSSRDEFYMDRTSATATTSFKDQESSDPVSVNDSTNKNAVHDTENSVDNGLTQICPEPSCSYSQSLEDSGTASAGCL